MNSFSELKKLSNSKFEKDEDQIITKLNIEEEKFNYSLNNFGLSNKYNEDSPSSKKKRKELENYSFSIEKIVVGEKHRSSVFQAIIKETGETIAIKKVLYHKEYKNRELEILKQLNHPNIIYCRHSFYTKDEEKDQIFIYFIMDYMPETLQKLIIFYNKIEKNFPKILLKIFSFQILKALSYLHSLDICHRNIHPKNILIDPSNYTLKICDFGSAKKLIPGELHFSNVCSKYYKAPEILKGSNDYSLNIDLWSAGCVIAEMVLGLPLFQGDSIPEQLNNIYEIIGFPGNEELNLISKFFKEKNPKAKADWKKIFKNDIDPLFVDLISKLLKNNPLKRISALDALTHEFFDELKQEEIYKKFPGLKLTEFFTYNLDLGNNENLKKKLIPNWLITKNK